MKRQIINVFLTLALALGLCVGASAAEAADGAISVGGLPDGQYAFVAGYDETGRFLGARVLTADHASAQPIPGAVEMKLFRTDDTFAPQGEAVSLNAACQTVRKLGGQVTLCYEGPDGVTVTQPVTEKITGKVGMWSLSGSVRVWSTNAPSGSSGQSYPATALPVEGCSYTVSRKGFQYWSDQPGLPLNDTLDFYLDPWGNICWIDLVAEYVYPVETRLLLSVGITETSDGGAVVQAELLRSNGEVITADVSSLDGQPITDPDAAVAQLSASAPGGFYACQRQRDDTYSLTATQNTPDSGWGATLIIPPDVVTAPAADFTGGAVNCLANDETVFVLSRGRPGEEEVTRFVGYRDLPSVTVLDGAIITAEGDPAATPVARFVHLRTEEVAPPPPPPVEVPDGYVFLFDNSPQPDPELFYDDVRLVPIVDTDGTRTSMRVSAGLGLGISYDSMEVGRFADNFYVGRFCSVTKIDENAVASGLAPVIADNVAVFGNNVITTTAGTWNYTYDTRCVYVDLCWDDMNGNGVRDDADQVILTASGTFDPGSGFIDLSEVSTDPAAGATYRSIRAAAIPSAEDRNRAGYIYIVRELW